MESFKIETFKEEVYKELEMIKNLDQWGNGHPEFYGSAFSKGFLDNCLNKVFIRFVRRWMPKASKLTWETHKYDKYEESAEKWIIVDELRKNICGKLKTFPIDDVTDFRLVDIVVDELMENSFRQKFKVRPDKTLFAFICRAITKQGARVYCSA